MMDGKLSHKGMSGTPAKKIHIETVLGLFRILDLEIIDAETIVATYQVPPDLAEKSLRNGEQLGFFGEVDDGGYQLTPRGERKLSETTIRGGETNPDLIEGPS